MHQLSIRPSGNLHYHAPETSEPSKSSKSSAISQAFGDDTPAGLFQLAITRSASGLDSSQRYWRKFAQDYLNLRCRQPSTTYCEPLPSPTPYEMEDWVIEAPPMQGAEYLNETVLLQVWQSLDDWLCRQVNRDYKRQLADFLQDRAPHWHQIGRVCFHLAENKQDPEYPFAFMATYAAQVGEDGQPRFAPLAKALKQYASDNDRDALIHLLSPIDLAAKQSPTVKDLLNSEDIYHPLAWTANEAYQFIQEVPLYESCGIIVRLPNWWKSRVSPQVSVTIGQNKTALGTDSLLDFSVQTALGDKVLSPKEWQQLLASEDALVLFKGQWVEVNQAKLQQTLDHWKSVEQQVAQEGISFAEGMRVLAGVPKELREAQDQSSVQQWSFVHAGKSLKATLEHMRAPENINKRLPGKALKATLRPYQKIGVNWLAHLSELGLGACLADDMGLGKTIQVIALLLTRKKITPKKSTSGNVSSLNTASPNTASLLVLPASLINNWQSEVEKFAPSLKLHIVHPAFISSKDMSNPELAKDKHLVITTYGMVSRQEWLQNEQWQLLILDEAQAIKNPGTKQTRTIKRLKAQARIALTGTPIENRLSDLWSLFDFLSPGLLGSATAFKAYIKSREKLDTDQYGPLRKLISPYILRRLKSDKSLIADLPDKTEVQAFCSLSKRQAVLYEKSVVELQKALDKKQGDNDIQRRGLVLSYLLRFKQICNHPSQWLGDGEYKPEASGKFARLAELAEEIAARQEKVLIFTQFKEMTQVLADFLADIFGRPGLVLNGSTPVKQRKVYVDDFQREEGPPFFVLSIKAGGTGLNLTAASHVIHFDRWWNPAVENQATDRAYRIGQKRNVLVHKFVCTGTVEEKIDTMISAKSALAESIIGTQSGAEQSLTEMSDDALIRMVSLELNQIT
ncbi:MAG: ATP-dependent helicase [Alteromonadaceae bacterium]|nr:MAG: ATP-dependent helicase [Alteromonadaceae bacterium]